MFHHLKNNTDSPRFSTYMSSSHHEHILGNKYHRKINISSFKVPMLIKSDILKYAKLFRLITIKDINLDFKQESLNKLIPFIKNARHVQLEGTLLSLVKQKKFLRNICNKQKSNQNVKLNIQLTETTQQDIDTLARYLKGSIFEQITFDWQISFKQSTQLSFNSIFKVQSGSKSLKSLLFSLKNYPAKKTINEDAIVKFFQAVQHIQNLNSLTLQLSDIHLSKNSLPKIVKSISTLAHLQELNVQLPDYRWRMGSEFQKTVETFSALNNLNIQNIHFSGVNVGSSKSTKTPSNFVLGTFLQWANVQQLILKLPQNVGCLDFSPLKSLSKVKKLQIEFKEVNKDNITNLDSVQYMKELREIYLQFNGSKAIQIMPDQLFKNLPISLKKMCLEISEHSLQFKSNLTFWQDFSSYCKNFSQIEYLDINIVKFFQDNSKRTEVIGFNELKNLKYFKFHAIKSGAEFVYISSLIQAIGNMKGLKHLDIEVNVPDSYLEQIDFMNLALNVGCLKELRYLNFVIESKFEFHVKPNFISIMESWNNIGYLRYHMPYQSHWPSIVEIRAILQNKSKGASFESTILLKK